MFKIATWNVNSINVRLAQVLDWLSNEQADVLAIQETKSVNEKFPKEAFKEIGYHVSFSGQKTYNGVAIASKKELRELVTDIPQLVDEQRRIMAASYGSLRVVNIYVPNGQSLDSEKYTYKLNWLAKITQFIEHELKSHANLIVLGDFNIAPQDADVHDPKKWEGSVLVSQAEREAFEKLQQLGLSDCFRLFQHDDNIFSWWDYRRFGFKRNDGLRIDHILISEKIKHNCERCYIDLEPRRLERPSDHAPVVAEFSSEF